MRRVSIVLAGCLLAALAAANIADAAPTVKFKAFPVAIKGYPKTGNILGAGAAVQAEYKISGTEYGGFPPPLIGINFYLPEGHGPAHLGLPHVRAHDARTGRPVRLFAHLGRRPGGQSARDRLLRLRTGGRAGHARILLRARRGSHVLHQRPLARVAGNPLQGPLRPPRRGRGLRPGADRRGAARLDRPRSALRVGRVDQRQGRLRPQGTREARLLRHACPRSARRAAF